MRSIVDDDISKAATIAGLCKYTGSYSALGGGEINDTFLLDCGTAKAILRIARYDDQTTLNAEAEALRLLDLPEAPKLIFFDSNQRIKERLWIAESYISGEHVDRLTESLFRSLGSTLARVHATTSRDAKVDMWGNFLKRRNKQGDENILLNHPDERLKELFHRVRNDVKIFQANNISLPCSIIHGDATPTNILVNGDSVALIDWEFAHLNDPMAEFSTIYYEDIDYNNGKWRVHINADEKEALFTGYLEAGGRIDEDRIRLWMNIDKLGASLYLYWRLKQSGRETTADQTDLFTRELNKLIRSLDEQY